MPIDFSAWSRDHISEPLDDYAVALLHLGTTNNPPTLQAIALDFSSKSHQSLSLIQGVVGRSSLEHLALISNHAPIFLPGRYLPSPGCSSAVTSQINRVLWQRCQRMAPAFGDKSESFKEINASATGFYLQRLEITSTGAAPQ